MPNAPASPSRIKFWGTRGSIAVPGPDTLRYGGNTTSVEVRADNEIIVLDAGSGIRSLGMALEEEFGEGPIKLSLLITHAHWDHIQGLPFFPPAYDKKNEIRVSGYDGVDTGFGEILAEPMKAADGNEIFCRQSAGAGEICKPSWRLRRLSHLHKRRFNRFCSRPRALRISSLCQA